MTNPRPMTDNERTIRRDVIAIKKAFLGAKKALKKKEAEG